MFIQMFGPIQSTCTRAGCFCFSGRKTAFAVWYLNRNLSMGNRWSVLCCSKTSRLGFIKIISTFTTYSCSFCFCIEQCNRYIFIQNIWILWRKLVIKKYEYTWNMQRTDRSVQEKLKKKKELKIIFSTTLILFLPSACFSALPLHPR